MKRPLRTNLRLSSLECLEPRTVLHAALPSLIFGSGGEASDGDRRHEAPRHEPAIAQVSLSNPPARVELASSSSLRVEPLDQIPSNFVANIVVTYTPPTQVVLVIYLPPNVSIVSAGQPGSISVRSTPSVSDPVSRLISSARATPEVSVRNFGVSERGTSSISLSGLGAFSALLSDTDASSGLDSESEADADNPPADRPDQESATKTQTDNSRDARAVNRDANLERPSASADDSDDLIDLAPDEEGEIPKRKLARQSSGSLLLSTRVRDPALTRSSLPTERSESNELLLPWRVGDHSESLTPPANEDLIDLLAMDQLFTNPLAANSNAENFITPSTRLEASLALPGAVELLEDLTSELAATLPVEQPNDASATSVANFTSASAALPTAEPK